MQARWMWTGASATYYVVILYTAGRLGGGSPDLALSPWIYGTVYFVLGGLLLGTVARWWQGGSPLLWRPLMLCLGLMAATVEAWPLVQNGFTDALLTRWSVALLGLLAAALVARLLPEGVIRLWLGFERRQQPADS